MKTYQITSLPLFVQYLNSNKNTAMIINKMKTGDFNSLFYTFLAWLCCNNLGRLDKSTINQIIQSCESWHDGVIAVLSKLSRTIDTIHIDEELPKETKKIYDFAFNAELQILAQSQAMRTAKQKTVRQNISDFCNNLTKFIKINNIQLHHQERHEILELLAACFGPENLIRIEQQLTATLHKAKIKITSAEQLTLADL